VNVIPLSVHHRKSGTTETDARLAARFIHARPGWRLAERVSAVGNAYLELVVNRPDKGISIVWDISRTQSGIAVESAASGQKIRFYPKLQDALLGVWEDAERLLASLDEKPLILLFGLCPATEVAMQDLAVLIGFDPLVTLDQEVAFEATRGSGLAAAVVDLQPASHGGDSRAVIRRLRQDQPNLPVLALTKHAHTAPEADLHGLGGPTHRERLPCNPDRVVHGLQATFHACR